MKKILMIAFHYPPFSGSSSVQRALQFSRYLPIYGWEPIIVTAHPRAYSIVESDQVVQIPKSARIYRAFALDAARHLSIAGVYTKLTALPDRYVSWWLGAVPLGLYLVRKHQPKVIWSTYPVATAHLIALTLHRLTKCPWVADFRDSMTEEDYPRDRMTRAIFRWIERKTVKVSLRTVFTTPGALRMYEERYPEISKSRWAVIENGYDDDSFREVERTLCQQRAANHPLVLVHSGVLYPSERDPTAFFAALGQLYRDGKISPKNLTIVFRATGHDGYYRQLLEQAGVQDLVSLGDHVPYRTALAEMLNADGLLMFQASNCNHQIPAKVYEYLRTRRPIFAMTDPMGDTARLLKAARIDTIVPLDSRERIAQGLLDFLTQVRNGSAAIPSEAVVAAHNRKRRTEELADLLNSLKGST